MASNAIILAFQPAGLQPTGSRTDGGSTNNIVPFNRRPQGVNPGIPYPPPSLTGSAVNKFPIPPSGGASTIGISSNTDESSQQSVLGA